MTLRPNGYKKRLIEGEIERSLKAFGCVCIEGPKWCGKTWVGLNMSNSAYMVGQIGHGTSFKELAEIDVFNALGGDPPHLIDEWQDVPTIWDAVRSEIDSNSYKGQYILTGSSTPKTNKPVHSGTGRIRRICMRTMSLYESGDSSGSVSLADIMDSKDIENIAEETTLEELVELTIRGGWPSNIGLSSEICADSVRGYLESIIHDASVLDGIRRNESNVRLVLRSLARNEGTLASCTKIHNDTGVPMGEDQPLILKDKIEAVTCPISYDTVNGYLDVFDRLHLLANQPAFDPNLKSGTRVGKNVKRHLVDPSLAVAALNVDKERLMIDLKTFGCLFESLCERDLAIYSEYIGAKQYHYRDSNGLEVDSVIEMPDGRWGAFEIKLGSNQINAAISNLRRFKDAMTNRGANSTPSALCVICGVGDRAFRTDDGVYVVPITSLKP